MCAQEIVEQKKTVGFAFGTIHKIDQQKIEHEVYAPLGTVFFVAYHDSRTAADQNFIYLVTAKHVLKDADGHYMKTISVRLNIKDQLAEKGYDEIANITVSDSSGNLAWFHDSNDAIDVAATPLLPNQTKFDFKAIPVSMFVDAATLESNKVAEGDSIFFIGLMARYFGRNKIYPIVRHGNIAMMTNEEIDTPTGRQKAFIVELVSWPGNSGSPVFLNLGGMRNGSMMIGTNPKFIGILSGDFLNKIEGTALNSTNVYWGDGANTGIVL